MSRARHYLFYSLLILGASCQPAKFRDYINGTWAGKDVPFIYDNLDNSWKGDSYQTYQYAYFGGGLERREDDDDAAEMEKEAVEQAKEDAKSDQKVADAGLDPRKETHRLRHSLRYVRRSAEELVGHDGKTFKAHFSFITDDIELAKRSVNEKWKLEHVTTDPKKRGKIDGLKEVKLNTKWKLEQGVNMLNSQVMADISGIIYLNFETAAQAFHDMGFDEQYFFWQSTNGAQYDWFRRIPIRANQFDGQGVVLKKNPKDGQEGFIVVAFRGTEPEVRADRLTDAAAYDIRLGIYEKDKDVEVHGGFYKSMKDMFHFVREHIPSTLENNLRRELAALKWETPEGKAKLEALGLKGNVKAPEDRPVFFTGHSLGASLATAAYGELVMIPQVMVQIARHDLHAYAKTVNQKWEAVGRDMAKLAGLKAELPSGLTDHHYFADDSLRQLDYFQVKALINKYVKTNVLSETEKEVWKVTSADPSLSLKLGNENIQFPGLIRLPILEANEAKQSRRVHSLITFGSPRAGNEAFKVELENYARAGLVTLQRVENTWRPADNLREFLGDLVTRVPIDLKGKVAKFQYRHVGYRMSYTTGEKDLKGDHALLTCEYTNSENEAKLRTPFIFDTEDGDKIRDIIYNGKYHMMDLYKNRIESYLDTDAKKETGDIGLAERHPCRNFRVRGEDQADTPDFYM